VADEWDQPGHAGNTDRGVIEAKQTVAQVIAQLVRTLKDGIATLDGKICGPEAHADFLIFQSLPGAGAALAPRSNANSAAYRRWWPGMQGNADCRGGDTGERSGDGYTP
jgi:hypothetical protein